MKFAILHSLHQALADLFAGRLSHAQLDLNPQETPRVDSASQRQYFVSHIDDYCDCV